PSTRWRTSCAAAWRGSFCATRMACARSSVTTNASSATPIFATTFFSTSTSMATQAVASAPRIRRDGRAWEPSSSAPVWAVTWNQKRRNHLLTQKTTYPNPLLPTCPVPRLLQGQKALVTGANSGIGKAVAIALGQAGADVVVNYVRDVDSANEVVKTIAAS